MTPSRATSTRQHRRSGRPLRRREPQVITAGLGVVAHQPDGARRDDRAVVQAADLRPRATSSVARPGPPRSGTEDERRSGRLDARPLQLLVRRVYRHDPGRPTVVAIGIDEGTPTDRPGRHSTCRSCRSNSSAASPPTRSDARPPGRSAGHLQPDAVTSERGPCDTPRVTDADPSRPAGPGGAVEATASTATRRRARLQADDRGRRPGAICSLAPIGRSGARP